MMTRRIIRFGFFAFAILVAGVPVAAQTINSALLSNFSFTSNDAVLLVDDQGQKLFEWRAEQALVPASLVKIVTSWAAIEQWGLDHQFKTEFYRLENQLWVKGFGDPFLTSEELERVATELNRLGLEGISSLHIDGSYFADDSVPGRSRVADPYNAPLSAVSANFNTVFLKRQAGNLISAEPQTPITETAIRLASSSNQLDASIRDSDSVRVNLRETATAQRYFAELLTAKAGLTVDEILVNQRLPSNVNLLYRHKNSQTLKTVLSGTMLYSNNFIANQVFLKLSESATTQSLNFRRAELSMRERLHRDFGWQGANIVDGSGLSRDNQLSAEQIDEVLQKLKSHQHLFKRYNLSSIRGQDITAYAKTGTLNDVSNFAGFLSVGERQYRFVFMFNRQVPYGYRDKLLKDLAFELASLQVGQQGQ